MRTWTWAIGGGAVVVAALVGATAAPVMPTVRYAANGDMLFPAEYRTMTFLTSGHGMSYDPGDAAAEDAPFDNIFVDPRAHAAFLKTGRWPEGAVLLIERRRGSTHGSINLHGAFQAGAKQVIEAHVHDSKRFKGGWGFFVFRDERPAKLIDYSADCYSCHREHAAVDTTFVQFYPTLLPVATAKRTLSKAYLAQEAKR